MQRKALRTNRRAGLASSRAVALALVCGLSAATSLVGQAQNRTQDLKKAQREVQQGEKAEAAGHWDNALAFYDAAAKDPPGDLGIVGHAAALRAKLVPTHVALSADAAVNRELRRAPDELRTSLTI